MGVANKSSRYCWAYETVPGIAEIVANNTVTYEFGNYNDECGDWNIPFTENPSMPYYVYSKRTPSLIDAEKEFPTFSHVFNPVTAQCFAWMLKKPSKNDPVTDIVALEEGMTYPLTIRLEESGGTVPMLTQAVGCYCVGLTVKAERDRSLMVETTFAWQKMEDLATTTRPILTTAPVAPGKLMSGNYSGNPQVKWDVDGDNHDLQEVWRADWTQEQEFETVSSDEGVTQIVYTYKFKPVQIILSAVFEDNDGWDDYFNRKVSTNMTIKVYKQDLTSYILATFTNCRIVKIKKTGVRHEGHYGAVCNILAEKVEYESDWFTEGGTDGTWATHWKALVA